MKSKYLSNISDEHPVLAEQHVITEQPVLSEPPRVLQKEPSREQIAEIQTIEDELHEIEEHTAVDEKDGPVQV